MGEQRENKKTTSIARRINIRFWFQRLACLIAIDIAIFALLFGSFMLWQADKLTGDGWENWDDIEWEFTGSSYETLELHGSYILHTDKQEEVESVVLVHDFFDYTLLPMAILLGLELWQLVAAAFHTKEIRRMLRPLNDLAIRADVLSTLTGPEVNLEHLEAAIERVHGDENDIQIHTGDRDLQGIEAALNSLLARMQESKRQQTRFVSDASHELRTPISVIQGYVNMLDRWGKEDPEVLEESIEALKNESEHMKELIEQLLFLARGDSGRNTLKKVQVDLNEIVKEVWEESMMIDEGHVYEFKDRPNTMIYGDVAMIKQSLRIFVQNAAKYSPAHAPIVLSVGTENGRAYYQILDEGIGMQEEDVVHIFERFYRSDEARNGETGGSGLGLSIAKWIVDAHEGNIEVVSRPEFGTKFIVYFSKIQ